MAKKLKAIKTSFAVFLIVLLCFSLTGCLSAATEDDSGYAKLVQDLNDLKIASMGNGEQTGEYAYAMITHLTDVVFSKLEQEYGPSAVVERDSQDTHKNAKEQDGWLWQFDFATQADDVKALLQYNFSCVLCGKTPLNITPTQIASVDANLFNRGENGGLRQIANEFYHTGYYFYEVDNLAEYVLANVIGENVVQTDNFKFVDVNNNGTFDYVENYNTNQTYNIISSYEFPYAGERDEEVQKNGVWSRIDFKTSPQAPTVTDDQGVQGKEAKDIIVASQVTAERALLLSELQTKISDYVTLNALSPEDEQAFLAQFKQRQDATLYSGFKNYVNTIYYILYSSMYNFAFELNGEVVDIENVLTMTHMPNIVEDIISIEDSMYDEENQKFNIPCKEYKSVLVTSKKMVSTSNYYIIVYTNMQENLQLDVKLRYHFTDDAYREYIGTYSGESHTVEGHIMTFDVPPNTEVGGAINLTITPETLPGLQERGLSVTEEDITPLARQGVNNIILGKYRPYSYFNPTYQAKWWSFLEGYTAEPNISHLGSSFTYHNELADFLEIVFDVRGSYQEEVSFGFGFIWL